MIRRLPVWSLPDWPSVQFCFSSHKKGPATVSTAVGECQTQNPPHHHKKRLQDYRIVLNQVFCCSACPLSWEFNCLVWHTFHTLSIVKYPTLTSCPQSNIPLCFTKKSQLHIMQWVKCFLFWEDINTGVSHGTFTRNIGQGFEWPSGGDFPGPLITS